MKTREQAAWQREHQIMTAINHLNQAASALNLAAVDSDTTARRESVNNAATALRSLAELLRAIR